MEWVYLSPHLDDAVYSCGAIIWEQVRAGEAVTVCTICAGEPVEDDFSGFARSLHARWGMTGVEAIANRKTEDRTAVNLVSANLVYLDVLDCIYRKRQLDGAWIVKREEDLWQQVGKAEMPLVAEISDRLGTMFPGARIVSPLTIGNHVDHKLTRLIAERMPNPLYYYPDFPYARKFLPELDFTSWTGHSWEKEKWKIAPAAFDAWVESVAAYSSQISTFWADAQELRSSLQMYFHSGGGTFLWRADR